MMSAKYWMGWKKPRSWTLENTKAFRVDKPIFMLFASTSDEGCEEVEILICSEALI
jgi:hypothetical protein